MTEQEEYRVVLVFPASRQILAVQDRGTFCLPRIVIPKWTRPVEELADAIYEKWQLRSFMVDFLADESGYTTCAVAEVRAGRGNYTDVGLVPVEAYRIGAADLTSCQRETLEEILRGDSARRAPVSHIGWVDEAMEWIRAALCDASVEFTDQTRQLNACGPFALVRFQTKRGPAYWLKAVGEPNTHEFTITTYLAENCPTYLAPLICARADWNAWVMEEAGQPLPIPISVLQVQQVVARIAEMQRALVGKAPELLSSGCVDHCIQALEAHIEDLFAYLEEAMCRQVSTRVPRIEKRRMRELEGLLREGCSRMAQLGIPDTLIHSDLNRGNILVSGCRCVFADWCEAYVGNPFLIIEQLCALVARKEGDSLPAIHRVRAHYGTCWRDFFTDYQTDQALRLAPLLAALSSLYGRGSWLTSRQREDPYFQSHVRSLTRYMDRAAKNLDVREALWH